MDLSINANKIRQSYFKGFIDISGGGVYLRNDLSMNFFDNINSSQPKFSIKSDSIQIRDNTGTYYTVSNEKLLFIKDLTQNVETKINDLVNRTQYITSDGTDVSNVNISKNLVVSGDATFNNGLTTNTQDNNDNSTLVATTAFVKNQGYAVKDSTILTGATTIQTATVNQKFFVTGDTSLNSKLFVFSTSTLNNKLFVAGDVSLNNKLFVAGDVSLNNNVNIGGTLTTTTQSNSDSSTKVATTAFVKNQGYAQLTGANFTGDISLNARLFIGGDTSLNSNLFIAGDVSLNGNLNIGGLITSVTQTNNDNSTKVATTAFVKNQGYSTIESPTFTGTVTIPEANISNIIVSDASVNGNLYVVTQANNDNSIKVATTAFVKNQGYSTVESPTFTGTVTAPTTNISTLLVSGDASLNSRLYVEGDVSFNGSVNVAGILTTATQGNSDNSTRVATTAFVKNQGYAQLAGANFTGDVTTSSRLYVTDDTSLNGKLTVTGEAIFSSDVTAPTQNTNDSSTKVATTAYVKNQGYSKLVSPQFTGVPTAPTPTIGTNTSQIATTQYVRTEIYSFVNTIPDLAASISQLSDALKSTDASFATTLAASVGLKADKESPTFSGIANLPTTIINDTLTAYGETTIDNNLIVTYDLSVNGIIKTSNPLVTDNSTKVATTSYVQNQGYAKLSGATFTGDLAVNTKISSNGDANLNNRLFIGSDASLNANLYVSGNTTLIDEVTIQKHLTVSDVSINGNLLIIGNLNAATQSSNENSTKVATTAFVQNQGYAKLSGATFTGDVSFNNNVSVTGDSVLNSLVVNNDSSLNVNLAVGGNIVTNANLIVTDSIYEKGVSLESKYAPITSPTFTGIVSGITKSMIDLSNVDNTSDLNKPISTATQNALDLKANIASPIFTGTTTMSTATISNNMSVLGDISLNGNLNLNGNLIAITPSSSDNSTFVATTAFVKNQGYAKLSGANFTSYVNIVGDVSINSNLVVGGDVSLNGNLTIVTPSTNDNSNKVATTAFVKNQPFAPLANPTFNGTLTAGDVLIQQNLVSLSDVSMNGSLKVGNSIYEKGVSLESKYAPIASPTFTGTVSGITKFMIDLSNVDNTSDMNKPISTTTQSALDLKANIASPIFTGTTTMSTATISNNMSVLGDISLNGNLNLNGNLTAITPSSSDNSTFVATTAFVKNQGYAKLTGASFTGDISTTSKFSVTGDVSLNSKVTFVGDVSLNSKVTFLGDVSLNSKVTFDGEVALNGTTTTITQLTADNSKKIATTEYVKNQNYATIQSPAFTGVPTAPTVNTTATTSNQIATTKYVENKITEFYSAASTETITALNQLSSALKDTDTSFATALANQLTLKSDIQSPTFNGLVSLPMTNISENLHVDGDISMNGTLYVDGPVYEYGNLLSSKYATIASPAFTGTVTGITKTMVNLSNVDNTSDIDKPVSTATQSALDLKANIASPSFTGRLATTGNVVVTQNITVGGNGAVIGNLIVSKSIYENGSSLSSVYAPIASPTFTGIVSGITKSMIDLSNVDNTSDLDKPVSTATQSALNLKANITSPNLIGNVSISNNLLLSGDASFNGKLFVSGDVSLNGTVTGITQNANDNSTKIATTAFVKSQNQAYAQLTGANFTGDISLNARLFVGSDVSMNSKLFVSSDVSLNNRVNIGNDVTMNRRLFVKNDVSMNGNLYVTSTIYENGSALSSKYATTEAPSFSGTTTVERIDVTLELLVNADSKLYGKLDVTDDVTMTKNLHVGQSIYENGTALSSKYATLASPSFTGTVSGITKSMIDLSNVDNTSDLNKPVSTATQTALNLKANIASPTFTGIPNAPTASSGTNTTQIATTAFVKGEINNLVDNAPDGLNTLKELALAINNDASFSNTIATSLELKSNIASPTFTGTVTIGTLNLTNDLSLNSNLVIGGDVSLNGNLYANYPGNSIPSYAIQNLRNEYGQLEIQCQRADIVTFDEEGFETSRYAGSGGFIETLYARNSDLSLNGNIYINGNGISVISTDTSLNGNLYVGKNVFMSEDVSINNNLDLSGSLIAHNNVNVYGIINQYTVSLDQGYIVNYANSETTIQSLQAQITSLQQQLASVLQILSNNNIQ